ncbi:MAG: (Fe-S)-binding protein [Nitrospirota bacterium]
MASADLYLEKVNLLRYLNKTDCAQCGSKSCDEFISAIRDGIKKPQDCPFLSKNEVYAFEVVLMVKDLWPDVPLLTHPRPGLAGLIELNSPDNESLVLISGNNEYTEQVILTILGTTIGPFFVIFVDTNGDTIDMAMIYQTLTAEKVYKALQETGIEKKTGKRELIIPGFAASIKEDIEKLTGWRVKVGPICAAELPLFLSEFWTPPEK